jgi:Mn2+/Fe2+ NRAMP family transporter
MAVSILGASISPYLFLFYSSGAIEDKWDKSYLGANRVIAGLGMSFGGTISVAVLITAFLGLSSQGIVQVDDYHQLPLPLIAAFGFWGFVLFILSLGIACLGAVLEVALEQAYLVAQAFGWNWGEDLKPKEDPAFCAVYTLSLLVSALPIIIGVDPLKLTVFSMALTAASLPLTVIPFLFLMNDKHYLGDHGNSLASNMAVLVVVLIGCVLALVTIPLQLLAGT